MHKWIKVLPEANLPCTYFLCQRRPVNLLFIEKRKTFKIRKNKHFMITSSM